MEKPKCKICGQRHYGLCGSVGAVPLRRADRDCGKAEEVTYTAPLIACSSGGSTPPSAAKFDRVAYQREYMRKWRADQKARKTGDA